MTVPKGTPKDVKDTIAEAMQATFETEEYQAFNEQNSLTPMEISGDEVVAQLEEDKERYADLVEEYGINLGGADPAEPVHRRGGHDDERRAHAARRAGRTSWPRSRPRWPTS